MMMRLETEKENKKLLKQGGKMNPFKLLISFLSISSLSSCQAITVSAETRCSVKEALNILI